MCSWTCADRGSVGRGLLKSDLRNENKNENENENEMRMEMETERARSEKLRPREKTPGI